MEWVKMKHPDLDATIEVASSAVVHHEASGWEALPPEPGDVITREQFIERYGYDPMTEE